MLQDNIVITQVIRTPIGNFLGELEPLTAPELGSLTIKHILKEAKINKDDVDQIFMGCILTAGQGQAPARQASIYAGLPSTIPCTTINKMCGSGMETVILAHDTIKAGSATMIIAGGMESMSNAPYLLPQARTGYRLGHQKVIDHLLVDGIEDAYEKGKLMGLCAEDCAEKYQISRTEQDEYAKRSVELAQAAMQTGVFKSEIVPIRIDSKDKIQIIDTDEGPRTVKTEKIPLLKPIFKSEGTVTAANSSAISDGAASLLITHESHAKKLGLQPIAKIIGHSVHAQDSNWFTTAPIPAIQKLLKAINWQIDDVDLFEINEAFAVVPLVVIKELKIPLEKINIHGGACVLGHPIGASGARILVTLINALKQRGLKRGIAAICIGGGEATAMAVELIR